MKNCKSCNNVLILFDNFTLSNNNYRIYLCNICYRIEQRNYNKITKNKVIDKYGGKCDCCGLLGKRYLSIDHINNDGGEHKKQFNLTSGSSMYHWIINNNYPNTFRVLCHNCNCALGHCGYCPHKTNINLKTNKAVFIQNGITRICRICGIQLSESNTYKYLLDNGKNICKNDWLYNEKIKNLIMKEKIMNNYGGHCGYCFETKLEFLTIDHIFGGGSEHRKKVGFGKTFYKWLINNNYPKDNYQILCYNCNCSKEYENR